MADNEITVDDLLKAYAISLQAYDDANRAFRAEPTGLNVSTLHRWLDRLMLLRTEIERAGQLEDALAGTRTEPTIREMLTKLAPTQSPEPDQHKEER